MNTEKMKRQGRIWKVGKSGDDASESGDSDSGKSGDFGDSGECGDSDDSGDGDTLPGSYPHKKMRFVWARTSCSGDGRRCYQAGRRTMTNKER